MNVEKTLNNKHLKGFTLIELLVVIAIIAILAAILVPVVGRAKTKAKVATAKVQMAELERAITTYKIDYSRFPIPKDYPRNEFGDVTVGGGMYPYYPSAPTGAAQFGLTSQSGQQRWGLYGGVVGKKDSNGTKSWAWDDEYKYKGRKIPAHLMRNNDTMAILLNEDTSLWEKKWANGGNRLQPNGWAESSPTESPDTGWWHSPRFDNGDIKTRQAPQTSTQLRFRPPPARANVAGYRNPKKNKYLDVKESDYSILHSGRDLNAREVWRFESNEYNPAVELPGMSPTRIYRDPFGNEFVISMDLNGNGYTCDQFYSAKENLTKTIGLTPNNSGVFGVKSKEVIIWSSGPDKYTNPYAGPSENENGDNIISWR